MSYSERMGKEERYKYLMGKIAWIRNNYADSTNSLADVLIELEGLINGLDPRQLNKLYPLILKGLPNMEPLPTKHPAEVLRNLITAIQRKELESQI